MSFEDLAPVELREFRGLHTGEGDQQLVPLGYSPVTQNTTFSRGRRVQTRPGSTIRASGLPGVVTLKEFVDLGGIRRLILTSDDGTLRQEPGTYTFATILSDIVEASLWSALSTRSQTLFGRETICFRGGNYNGLQPPRIYDGANADPFSTEPPAQAPTMVEDAAAGSITAGTHRGRWFFRTRNGYWTGLGPEGSYVATGLKKLDISNAPIGPPWVTARVFVMTPAFSNTYYFVEETAMVINDNTTTAIANLDISDSTLVAGTQVTSLIDPTLDLFRQTPASPWAGVLHYNGRLVFWGARSGYYRVGDIGPFNMRFQGGWLSGATLPCGWTEVVAGESRAGWSGSAYGDVLRITSNGAQRGVLENKALVQKWLPSGVQIGCRVRMRRNSTASSGTMSFYFSTTGAAATLPAAASRLDVPMSSLSTTEWRTVQGFVGTGGNTFGTTSTFRMSSGTGLSGSVVIPNAGTVDIDYIELYSPSYAGENSLSRLFFSKAQNPEAMDGLMGVRLVASEDGEAITSCFELKGALFAVKERSIYVLQDNGTGEPVNWPVDIVSSAVGSPARGGVALGDGWAVIAARTGLFFFDGSTPAPISDEISVTWKRINWAGANKIWTLADCEARRIYIGVPLDGSASVNNIISLDYGPGNTPANQADRDYSIWTLARACIATSLRSDGHVAVLYGDVFGQVSEVDTAVNTDIGTGINSIYRTAYLSSTPGRELIGGLTANIKGSGTLVTKLFGPDGATSITLLNKTLVANPNYDTEWYANGRGERLAVEFSLASGAFQLNNLIAWMKPKSAGLIRHHTP